MRLAKYTIPSSAKWYVGFVVVVGVLSWFIEDYTTWAVVAGIIGAIELLIKHRSDVNKLALHDWSTY